MYTCSSLFFNQTNWHKYGGDDTILKNTDANKIQIFHMHVVCKVSANIRTNFLRKG
jgi:hypothetical protein